MSQSERSDLSITGINASPDSETHGREPHQTDLGTHPATQFVGLVQDHENPQSLTMHERGVGRAQLGTKWIHVEDIEDTVNLEDQR